MYLKYNNYEEETAKLASLHDQDFSLWCKERKNLSEKTKFSLNEIFEYLELAISNKNNEPWTIEKTLFYNKQTGRLELKYYAVEESFRSAFKILVPVETEIERQTKKDMETVKSIDMMFPIGTKSVKINNREELFDFVYKSDNEKKNYLDEYFFEFPEEYDFLYQIIIDHINRKNNANENQYTKKAN